VYNGPAGETIHVGDPGFMDKKNRFTEGPLNHFFGDVSIPGNVYNYSGAKCTI
jgi:hypothetical protein